MVDRVISSKCSFIDQVILSFREKLLVAKDLPFMYRLHSLLEDIYS